ncbi:MAG: hypothetical protein WCK90_04500 [archaeon]
MILLKNRLVPDMEQEELGVDLRDLPFCAEMGIHGIEFLRFNGDGGSMEMAKYLHAAGQRISGVPYSVDVYGPRNEKR